MRRVGIRRGALMCAAAAVLTIAAGCGDDDEGSAATTGAPPASSATTAASETSANTPTSAAASTDAPTTADAGPSSGANTPEPQPLAQPATLKVGAHNFSEFLLPVAYAVEMGEFEKENLTVELLKVDNASLLPQLVQGGLDILGNGVSSVFLNANNEDINARFFQNTHVASAPDDTSGIYVRKDFVDANGELDPAKLSSGRLRASLGTSGLANGGSAIPLSDLLQAAGGDLGDVEIVSLNPGGDTLAALSNGSIDITQLLPPFSNDPLVAECCVKVRDLLATGRYVALAEDLEAQPEVFEAFARAILRTQRTYLQGDYYKDPKVVEFLAELTGAPLETVQAGSASYDFGDELENDVDAVEDAQELWLTAQANGWSSVILNYEEAIPVENLANTAIIEAVNGQ